MVQPSFSHPRKSQSETEASPTAALDAFLDNQHQSYFEELYKSEAVCLCILRLLPPVYRHIVLHVLWSHEPLKSIELKGFLQIEPTAPLEVCVDDFVTDDGADEERMDELIKPLQDRKIVGGRDYVRNKMIWPLNDTFKRGLRNALTGMGTSNSFGVPYDARPDEQEPSIDDLLVYGEETWESILKYMVSSGLSEGLAAIKPRQQVLHLLQASGLMVDRLTITSKGFQFLLEDRQTQLWQILIYYLTLREQKEGRSAEILSLFLSLGCMQLGQGYSATKSFPRTLQTLVDLEHYGFVHRRPKGPDGKRSDHFYPTHLSTSLCSGDLSSSLGGIGEGDEKRFLILETNYKIYAYTSNQLEIAILNLFVDIKVRYPNLVVGKLDRKHVKAAMEKGISAYQIISYLASHAHPQMYNSPPPLLHPTIVDQLHLWDKERNRLKTEETVMFEFLSRELYDDTVAEAHRYDGVYLVIPEKKLLFINPEIKEPIRDFVQGKQRELRGG